MKTLLVFTAQWCGVCQQIKPIIEIEAPQKGYMIEYIDLDTEQGSIDAEDYKVRSLPTLIVLDEERRKWVEMLWRITIDKVSKKLKINKVIAKF